MAEARPEKEPRHDHMTLGGQGQGLSQTKDLLGEEWSLRVISLRVSKLSSPDMARVAQQEHETGGQSNRPGDDLWSCDLEWDTRVLGTKARCFEHGAEGTC